jgi:hypothetical protein
LRQPRLDQLRIAVDPVVVAIPEVRGEVHAAAETSASDVEEAILWSEALRDEVLELQPPDLVPEAADSPAPRTLPGIWCFAHAPD